MNTALIPLLVLGVAAFIAAVLRGIGPDQLLNVDALLIIFGGTVIALLIGFPVQSLKAALRDVRGSFAAPPDSDGNIAEILTSARMFRLGDIRGIEARLPLLHDDFLRRALMLLINNHDERSIRQTLEREYAKRAVGYGRTLNILRTAGRLTPALGLAGTVVSLIKMFHDMSSVEAVAPLMAVALMSTFYGVVVSNVVMMPLAAKIRETAVQAETGMQMVLDGVIAIYHGEHPMKIEERLTAVGLQGALSECRNPAAHLAEQGR